VSVNVRASAGSDLSEDRAFIRDLGRRTAMSSVGSIRPAGEESVLRAFDRLMAVLEQQTSHVTLIARRNGERAGFLVLLNDLPDEVTLLPGAFVAYMAVEPAARRTGVGAALLAAAEDEARRRGVPYIALMVSEENEGARRLYGHAGYHTERRLLCKAL